MCCSWRGDMTLYRSEAFSQWSSVLLDSIIDAIVVLIKIIYQVEKLREWLRIKGKSTVWFVENYIFEDFDWLTKEFYHKLYLEQNIK